MRNGLWKRAKPASKSESLSRPGFPRLNLGHGVVFVLGLCAGLAFYALAPSRASSSLTVSTSRAEYVRSVAPWGNLVVKDIVLEQPEEKLPESAIEPRTIHWFFEGMKEAAVESYIARAAFTEDQKRQLGNRSLWKVQSDGVQISPPLEVIRGMSLEARTNLYRMLGGSAKNTSLQSPARIQVEDFDLWLNQSELSEPVRQLVRQLACPAGGWVLIYDTELLEWLCPPAERKTLFRTLARVPSLLVKLSITPETDVDALTRYWVRDGGKAMKPFLQSLKQVPEGAAVSVSFFFPPFARTHLYTYPVPGDDSRGQDCFWTAMNFYNETPDERFRDPRHIQQTLRTEYREVRDERQFGDVILFADGERAIHMAVHVADEVVFTKNGAHWMQPWVLMRYQEMLERYTKERPPRVMVFRKINPSGGTPRDGLNASGPVVRAAN